MMCQECERLSAFYDHLVRDNVALLTEYHAALFAYDSGKIASFRAIITEMEGVRRYAREILAAHRGTHVAEFTAGRRGPERETALRSGTHLKGQQYS